MQRKTILLCAIYFISSKKFLRRLLLNALEAIPHELDLDQINYDFSKLNCRQNKYRAINKFSTNVNKFHQCRAATRYLLPFRDKQGYNKRLSYRREIRATLLVS